MSENTIYFSSPFGSGLAWGTLSSDCFVIGSQAIDYNDRFIYNNSTGILSFDYDGAGGMAQFQFAQLSPGLAFSATNIFVTPAG
ncbi:hypothetical protein [Nostoc sp. DedQUE09]|uniref:hypothetical protein n=1 Tax=Nostoc sp. DedQUE09 TaxID=3075394 RepID=UPI002AD49600|nr:hypothetical protein [Nostoc sp. DedQUE09]MDZ7956288.1 hypothetical protein [Nostoc sp. DedQUE09]